MNPSKTCITTKQRLFYIRLIEKLFADEHMRNMYYKTIPRSKDEANREIHRLLASVKILF